MLAWMPNVLERIETLLYAIGLVLWVYSLSKPDSKHNAVLALTEDFDTYLVRESRSKDIVKGECISGVASIECESAPSKTPLFWLCRILIACKPLQSVLGLLWLTAMKTGQGKIV